VQDPQQVAHALEEIAALLRFAGERKFKVEAYERAAQVVRTLKDDLVIRVEQDRLRELQGIGPALSRQIQELWNTGSSALLERLRAEHPPGAGELIQVAGMTPRRIRALHAALDIRSVEQLREACMAQRVRSIAGFGEKTEQKLLESSEKFLQRELEVPKPLLLARALEIAARLEPELAQVVEQTFVVGAVRRGEELVDELEMLVVGDVRRALERLSRLRYVLRVDFDRRLAFLSDGITLTLHVAEPARLGNALVQATGNAEHLVAVQARAQARGIGSCSDEPALYAALGVSFVPPELRQGRDELETAAHDDFADLIALTDIRGFVHCHTSYSDGKNSVLEMARAAHALGMQYLTITDHSPSAHYASGVSLDRLKEQWDEIAAAQEAVPIRILRGTESDILSDGSLDFPDDILERFEVIIASIHARHRQDRATMTARLERALALPVFKIWGHALGRILNHRPPIDCDVPAILDVLARSRGAIELNADPHRLDLPPAWIPAARQRGIPFVISVDAHSTNGLNALHYGVTQARRGALRRQEVLNTLTAGEFAARVRPLGGNGEA
jgi:DNA polymerase (family X)